jgi:hypothetical protein
MSMDRLHLPMFAQPLHLLLSSLIFGVQLALMLVLQHAMKTPRQRIESPHEMAAAKQ